MITAISIVAMLVIIIAAFIGGAFVGCYLMGKKLADAICCAIDESDLTHEQKLALIEKVQQKARERWERSEDCIRSN